MHTHTHVHAHARAHARTRANRHRHARAHVYAKTSCKAASTQKKNAPPHLVRIRSFSKKEKSPPTSPHAHAKTGRGGEACSAAKPLLCKERLRHATARVLPPAWRALPELLVGRRSGRAQPSTLDFGGPMHHIHTCTHTKSKAILGLTESAHTHAHTHAHTGATTRAYVHVFKFTLRKLAVRRTLGATNPGLPGAHARSQTLKTRKDTRRTLTANPGLLESAELQAAAADLGPGVTPQQVLRRVRGFGLRIMGNQSRTSRGKR